MKWKFCEFCYINGHCENQDRGHKCECYGKKLEDKCERLEKQLSIATEALKDFANSDNWSVEQVDGEHVFCFNVKYPWRFTGEALKKIKELEK